MGDEGRSRDIEDASIKVYDDFQKYSSGPRVSPEDAIVSILRGHYPGYSVTVTPKETGIISFAQAGQAEAKLDTTNAVMFRKHKPAKGRSANDPGELKDKVLFGKYDYQWNNNTFIVYAAEWREYYRSYKITCILQKLEEGRVIAGRSLVADELIAAASRYTNDTHDEVYMYDQEVWTKNKDLWSSVQHSSWDDVILDSEMKEALVQDVQGFFDAEEEYKEFAVPWKRGVIFHGLPGNGKTCSIKALMHALYSRPDPIPTLYVKSLAGCNGPEYSIREIFVKAREIAPCLLILEDLDSLITDRAKSFFLNEIDGLESNDGIMMIGSTNHLEKLDAGISKRPGRFDRKYHFALPAVKERTRYCNYWRSKLSKNQSISFPPSLSPAIASITDGFSFAYLKEAFIAALLVLVAAQRAEKAGIKPNEEPESNEKENDCTAALPSMDFDSKELEENQLWRHIRKQVKTLKMQMEESRKSAEEAEKNNAEAGTAETKAEVSERSNP